MTTPHPFSNHVEPGEVFDLAEYMFRIGQSYQRHCDRERALDASVQNALSALERMKHQPVTIVESPTESAETVTATTTAETSLKQRLIDYIRRNESFTVNAACLKLNAATKTINEYMQALRKEGFNLKVKRIGNQRIYSLVKV